MREVQIKSNSGILSATIFDSTDPAIVLVIASATGVRQSFYKKFAEFMSSKNITVITFDYYGIGRSLNEPIKELTNNASDWGTKDLESVLNYTLETYPTLKKHLLGHSIGGQLAGLSKSSTKLNKIILVAAQSGYWKFWSGVGRIKMWANWHILFPVLLRFFDYLPSKRISGMENLPKNVAKQWSGWGRQKEYLFSEISNEESFFDSIQTELTAISIDDDAFAPKRAVDWMTEKYRNTNAKPVHLRPRDYQTKKIGHFGVFRDAFKDSIWQLLVDEVKNS